MLIARHDTRHSDPFRVTHLRLTCFLFDFAEYLKKCWFQSTLIEGVFSKRTNILLFAAVRVNGDQRTVLEPRRDSDRRWT